LYANDENNNHVGTFVSLSGDFQTMDDMCKEYGSAGSTLSHKNAKDKPSNLKFSWKAPADGAGLVQFRGFLVTKSQNTWLAFPPLNVSGPGSPADKSSASNNTDPTGAAAVNTASSPLTILLTSCLTLSFSITFFHRIFV
jgi:hypothetical protein